MAQLPSSHGIPQPSQPRKLRLGHKAHAEGTQNSSGQHWAGLMLDQLSMLVQYH
jgi:hypothetical protein